MNFVGTTTYEGTKKDADELYSIFKDDLAKCTSSFEWAHIREGKMFLLQMSLMKKNFMPYLKIKDLKTGTQSLMLKMKLGNLRK